MCLSFLFPSRLTEGDSSRRGCPRYKISEQTKMSMAFRRTAPQGRRRRLQAEPSSVAIAAAGRGPSCISCEPAE